MARPKQFGVVDIRISGIRRGVYDAFEVRFVQPGAHELSESDRSLAVSLGHDPVVLTEGSDGVHVVCKNCRFSGDIATAVEQIWGALFHYECVADPEYNWKEYHYTPTKIADMRRAEVRERRKRAGYSYRTRGSEDPNRSHKPGMKPLKEEVKILTEEVKPATEEAKHKKSNPSRGKLGTSRTFGMTKPRTGSPNTPHVPSLWKLKADKARKASEENEEPSFGGD